MAMFLGADERPVASGDSSKASAATLELILTVAFADDMLMCDEGDERRSVGAVSASAAVSVRKSTVRGALRAPCAKTPWKTREMVPT